MNPCFLLLEDGTLFTGKGFGAPAPFLCDPVAIGELVFNTSMTGYQEILTDPSYNGQMVVMTYPHIGNYGCNPVFEEGLDFPSKVSCTAMIVRSAYEGPLPLERVSLHEYLLQHGIPALTGVDTRALTIHLRNHGAQNALLFQTGKPNLTQADKEHALALLIRFPHLGQRDLIDGVATKEIVQDPKLEGMEEVRKDMRFAVVDFGIKRSIINQLYLRSISVTLFPPTVTAEQILNSGCDAMLLSNGPGDPALLKDAVAMTKEVLKTMPVFGICLGHQLITWALGGKTIKMKYGHHGGNHPVLDRMTGACFVTSQNHGYASDPSSIPEEVEVWFTNANDQSIEGLMHTTKPICCVQFHPEASPGPQDATWIFDRFIEKAKEART